MILESKIPEEKVGFSTLIWKRDSSDYTHEPTALTLSEGILEKQSLKPTPDWLFQELHFSNIPILK